MTSKGDITVTSPYDSPNQVNQDRTIAFAQLDIRDSRDFEELQAVGVDVREFGDSSMPHPAYRSSTAATCSPSSRCPRARSTG
ncbi:MAG: hypothetical protein WKF60_06245 [Ilumatobacter sp.]